MLQYTHVASNEKMKVILTLFMIMVSVDSFAQELNGAINPTKNNHSLNFFWVTAKGIKQANNKSQSTKADSLGHFKIKFEEGGEYRISIKGSDEPDTTFYLNVGQHETINLTINYPPKVCPYEKAKSTGICPEGTHKDNIVPIIYGLIIADKEFLKKVESHEVERGGCLVTTCDPNWYCKTHDRRF